MKKINTQETLTSEDILSSLESLLDQAKREDLDSVATELTQCIEKVSHVIEKDRLRAYVLEHVC